MGSKIFLLSRAAAVAGIVALALPAFAQSNPPATAPSTDKQISGEVQQKGEKKPQTAKQNDTHKQTAEKPSAKKSETTGAVKSDGAAKQ